MQRGAAAFMIRAPDPTENDCANEGGFGTESSFESDPILTTHSGFPFQEASPRSNPRSPIILVINFPYFNSE